MHLTILLFAGLRQRAGTAELILELDPSPPSLTVAELRQQIAKAHPELGSLDHCRFALGHEFVDEHEHVDPGQEIALIPPVSGGHDEPRSDPPRQVGPRAGVDQEVEIAGTHARLSSSPLSLAQVVAAVEHRGAGAVATFTGNVREHSRGKTVRWLEYEAYAPMALAVMDAIASRIEAELPGARVAIAHRVGRLGIGEAAVVIAASAPHRDEAFRACREAIEQLKRDVPIWKKEFDDQGGEWIGRGP